LHAVINPGTFSAIPLNTCDFVTSVLALVLGLSTAVLTYTANSTWIYAYCYNLKSLEWDKGQTLVLEKTQENSIESLLQNSLPYVLVQMVCASYCASYPKWPCVKHKVNMWYPCYMMSLCSKTFYFLLLSPVINFVTTPSDVTVWQCDRSLITLIPEF